MLTGCHVWQRQECISRSECIATMTVGLIFGSFAPMLLQPRTEPEKLMKLSTDEKICMLETSALCRLL